PEQIQREKPLLAFREPLCREPISHGKRKLAQDNGIVHGFIPLDLELIHIPARTHVDVEAKVYRIGRRIDDGIAPDSREGVSRVPEPRQHLILNSQSLEFGVPIAGLKRDTIPTSNPVVALTAFELLRDVGAVARKEPDVLQDERRPLSDRKDDVDLVRGSVDLGCGVIYGRMQESVALVIAPQPDHVAL